MTAPHEPVKRAGHRLVQLLDLHYFSGDRNGKLTRNEQEVPRGEMCYYASPYDCPAYIRFWRRLTDFSDKERKRYEMHDEGVTMEVDAFTFGVKVYVKWDRPKTRNGMGKLTVFVEDDEGREVVAQYER